MTTGPGRPIVWASTQVTRHTVHRRQSCRGFVQLLLLNRNQRARSLRLSRPPSTGLDTGLRRSNPVGKAALGFGMNAGYGLSSEYMVNRNQRARSLRLSRPPSTGLDTGLRRSNPVGKAALGFGMNEGYGAFLPRKRPDSGGAWYIDGSCGKTTVRVDGATVPCVAGEYSTGLSTLILTASHNKSLPIRAMTRKGHIAQLVTRGKASKRI